jgi:hypothetical protein
MTVGTAFLGALGTSPGRLLIEDHFEEEMRSFHERYPDIRQEGVRSMIKMNEPSQSNRNSFLRKGKKWEDPTSSPLGPKKRRLSARKIGVAVVERRSPGLAGKSGWAICLARARRRTISGT